MTSTGYLEMLCILQEIRAIRFLQAKDNACPSGFVQLSSAFTYYGHVCLVLERLHGSLLDYMVYSARLHRSEALHNFRKIALQLLVSPACYPFQI